MKTHTFQHHLTYHLRLSANSDDRAPGGAVTVALCGHWDHDGPCRWPHFSKIQQLTPETHQLVVSFNAEDKDISHVQSAIDAALRQGQLLGPDGRLSTWTMEQK